MELGRKGNILVADDEYVISRVVSFMFRKEGHTCRAVADGLAALSAMREDKPDVLILDLEMPKKTGYEVCRELREDPELKDIHVVILTARGHPMAGNWEKRVPADHFLLKPFSPRDLLAHVENFLGGKSTPVGEDRRLAGVGRP